MFQIFLNYLAIIIIPAFIGVITRLAFIKKQKGFVVSIVFICLFVITGLYAFFNSSNGSELPALNAIRVLCATLSSLICGLVSMIVKRAKRSN